MADITQDITALPASPHRGVDAQTVFVEKAEALFDAIHDNLQPELNAFATQANSLKVDVNTTKSDTLTLKNDVITLKSDTQTIKDDTQALYDLTVDVANYEGDWSGTFNGGLGYPTGATVSYTDGNIYYSKVADNTAEPVSETNNANWYFAGRKDWVYSTKSADYTAVHRDYIYVDTTRTAQVDTIDTFTAVNNTLYRVTIDGINFDYTSDVDATVAEIVAGLVLEINVTETNGSVPVTAANVADTSITLTADVPNDAFTATVNGNMSIATTTTRKTGVDTITLPATPTANDKVGFMDVKGNFSTNNLTIAGNGNNIMGLDEDMIVDTDNIAFELIYTDSNWRLK